MLLNYNFLYTAIAILHDVQALGRRIQLLTIRCIARDFLGIARGRNMMDACWIILYDILKHTPICKPISITSPFWNIQDAFFSVYILKNICIN